MITATDQKPGRDVVERYGVLKNELEDREPELDGILNIGKALLVAGATAVAAPMLLIGPVWSPLPLARSGA